MKTSLHRRKIEHERKLVEFVVDCTYEYEHRLRNPIVCFSFSFSLRLSLTSKSSQKYYDINKNENPYSDRYTQPL